MANQQHRELTLTRVFNAPRELVFDAWTDPKLVSQWWGPRGVSNPVCDINPTVGGNIHIVMLAGDELGELKGQEWPMKGTFKEVIKPEKLTFTSQAIVNDKPILETLVTVTFEDQEGKTRMNVHIEVTEATREAEGPLKGMEIGWNQSLDKLGEFLKTV